MDLEVELGQIFRPACLLPGEVLLFTEIDQVPVVHDNVCGDWGAFEIVPPFLEGPEYHE